MKNTKIAWMESQYLFPHHFQQQERYFESFIESRARAIAAYIWGFESLSLNHSLLLEGRLALTNAAGIMPDGCPFDTPSNAELPTPLRVDSGIKNQLVYLALPIYQAGSRHISSIESQDSVSRYMLQELNVYDYCADTANQETIETAGLRFQLLLESSNLGGFTLLPIARISEVAQEGAILLDKNFIPPCLNINNIDRLKVFLTDTIGLLKQRADVIAHRFNEDNKDKSASAIVDFMLLQMLNKYEPQLRHLQTIKQTHPERLFSLLQSLSGELSTFTTKGKRPFPHTTYQHDDLYQCYTPVINALNKQLSVVLEQTALSIPVEKRQFGIYVARLADRTLLNQARFILAVKSALPIDKFRAYFPSHVKIGSVETIRDLVNNQLTGITLDSLSVAPREITYHAGFIYYELQAQSEQWQSLQQSGGFAFHIAGDIPDLSIEFWAIRNN